MKKKPSLAKNGNN